MGGGKNDGFVSSGERARVVAARWRVSLRTAQSWLAAHPPVPVDDDDAMLAWVAAMPAATQKKLTASFRRRITEIRQARDTATPGGSGHVIDPDVAAYRTTHGETPANEEDDIAALKSFKAISLFKLKRAQARGDRALSRDLIDDIRHVSGVITEREMLAFRTGREISDMVSLSSIVPAFRAVPYWLNRGVEDAKELIAKRVSEASSTPLFPEEVTRIIEPILLRHLVLGPAVRSAQVSAPNSLPPPCVAALREGCALTLEQGAAEFNNLHNTPPPPPEPAGNDPDQRPRL